MEGAQAGAVYDEGWGGGQVGEGGGDGGGEGGGGGQREAGGGGAEGERAREEVLEVSYGIYDDGGERVGGFGAGHGKGGRRKDGEGGYGCGVPGSGGEGGGLLFVAGRGVRWVGSLGRGKGEWAYEYMVKGRSFAVGGGLVVAGIYG